MHILFCYSKYKDMLQKEIKDWTFEVYLLEVYWGTQFLIPPG